MSFEYSCGDPLSRNSAIDPVRQIAVSWEAGLGRRPEQGEIGGVWRFEHPEWSFSVFIEGEELDRGWEWFAPGSTPAGRKTFGPSPRMRLWTHSKPKKMMRDTVPDNINEIIAEAMIAIYSDGGKYPGVIKYQGPYGLKRTYAGSSNSDLAGGPG